MTEADSVGAQREAVVVAAPQLRAAGFSDATEIGRGGFGVVFRATQDELARVVAIKVLTVELDDNRARFIREQRAMGRLTGHPHIVAVLEVGKTATGLPFLVMPYYPRGSLHDLIQRVGRLPAEQALSMGVKLAGALQAAHGISIVHRDVKPANILLSDDGEPVLTDFGIAHMDGAFHTAAGIFTGSPAFTAPEVLGGETPTASADVYALGATLFSALTGRPAFERRSNEHVLAQFMRTASELPPDLGEHGIAEDVGTVIARAMARDPAERPTASELREQLWNLQAGRSHKTGNFAAQPAHSSTSPPPSTVSGADRSPTLISKTATRGRVPSALTSFVGRDNELADVRRLIGMSRLVTLTGIGGVGKTTLSMHAAAELREQFEDGVWFVELGELRDGTFIVELVAQALGLRDLDLPLIDSLVDFLRPRRALIVLDNCEQILDASAELVTTLLRECPRVQVLATSREVFGLAGEATLQVSPLRCPSLDTTPTLRTLSEFAAVVLFVDRARAAVPGFVLTDHNAAAVGLICGRLEGLPLAIELAAARLRAMSADQIAEGLADRFGLLTRGRRGAPQRQQALIACIAWSYDLCTTSEQQLWARLAVFAGDFALPAAHHICANETPIEDFLDQLANLVDKSILLRTENDDGTVRLRLLDTLCEYGRSHVTDDDFAILSHRHAAWYQRLLSDTSAQWFSRAQLSLIARLSDEIGNIREALQFNLSNFPAVALHMVADLYRFWTVRGMLGEGRRWLELALDGLTTPPSSQRVRALFAAADIANLQQDAEAAQAWEARARADLEVVNDPVAQGLIEAAEGYTAMLRGEPEQALACFRRALAVTDDYEVQSLSLTWCGWLLEMQGEPEEALNWFAKALSLAEERGEWVHRAVALMCVGTGYFWAGRPPQTAASYVIEGLHVTAQSHDLLNGARCLETLAWTLAARNQARRAVVLLAAARAVGLSTGAQWLPLDVRKFHDECEQLARSQLDPDEFQAAWNYGSALTFEKARKFALAEDDPPPALP